MPGNAPAAESFWILLFWQTGTGMLWINAVDFTIDSKIHKGRYAPFFVGPFPSISTCLDPFTVNSALWSIKKGGRFPFPLITAQTGRF